jgi:hypothetical protein
MKARLFSLILTLGIAKSLALSPPDALLNNLQAMSVTSLNFAQAGNGEQVALFIVNSNAATGFSVTFRFANGGAFTSGSNQIPMTSLVLDEVSGTLGEGLEAPVDLDVLHNLSGNEYVWEPAGVPTTETVNYIVELRASWADPAGKLAGLYFETITATISVGL